jgi:hypothetical protein
VGKKGHLLRIASSKVGLVLLCILLSRADVLKGQEEQSMPLDDLVDEDEAADQGVFAKTLTGLISQLYETLDGSFLDIFPAAPTESAFYVWQFLSLLVNNISMEQRHSLVVEVREKVLATVSSANETWISDLNIFLNSMGLDASQLVS